MNYHKNTRGWKSRKLLLVVFTMILCTTAFIATKWLPEVAVNFQVLVGALNGLCALYVAGNVGSKHVLSKTDSPTESPAP